MRDQSQAPIAGASVVLTAQQAGGSGSLIRSGPSGEFTFRSLAPGKYTVNGVPVEVGLGQAVSVTLGKTSPGSRAPAFR